MIDYYNNAIKFSSIITLLFSDSCQLIKNSPTKSTLSTGSTPHSSPIAQIKNQQHQFVIKSIMKNSTNTTPATYLNCNSSVPGHAAGSYSTLQHHLPSSYYSSPQPQPPALSQHHSSPTNGNFEMIEECNPQQVQRLNNYQTLPHHHHHHHYHPCQQHQHNKTATVHGTFEGQ